MGPRPVPSVSMLMRRGLSTLAYDTTEKAKAIFKRYSEDSFVIIKHKEASFRRCVQMCERIHTETDTPIRPGGSFISEVRTTPSLESCTH